MVAAPGRIVPIDSTKLVGLPCHQFKRRELEAVKARSPSTLFDSLYTVDPLWQRQVSVVAHDWLAIAEKLDRMLQSAKGEVVRQHLVLEVADAALDLGQIAEAAGGLLLELEGDL